MAEPLRATSISCRRCNHGTLFIDLHGEDGEVFATASMDVETGVEFLTQFGDHCEAILEATAAGKLQAAGGVH